MSHYFNDLRVKAVRLITQAEQDRIIKLLQDERTLCTPHQPCELASHYACDCTGLIALIKGDNK